jgi:hypothetical protein
MGKFVLTLMIMISLFSCGENETYFRGMEETGLEALGQQSDAPLAGEEDKPKGKKICDPFGEGSTHAGLSALVIEGKKDFRTFERYLEEGIAHETELILPSLLIEPRQFDQGFGKGENLIKNQKGEPLFEWFALKFKARFKLDEERGQEPGYYMLKTLSDDGSEISVSQTEDGEYTKILSYNGTTSPRHNCYNHKDQSKRSVVLVRLEAGLEKSIFIQGLYFQGPRHHIAFMVG